MRTTYDGATVRLYHLDGGVEGAIVVGVAGVVAGRIALTEEERAQAEDRVGDVDRPIVVAVGAEETGKSVESAQVDKVHYPVLGVAVAVEILALLHLNDANQDLVRPARRPEEVTSEP